MKKQVLTIALGLFTIVAFAQKNELKTAEKAIKKLDYSTAVSAINSAEGLIANADAKTKSKFYFLKAQAFGGQKNFEKAGEAYNQLFSFEKSTKKRYTWLELTKLEANVRGKFSLTKEAQVQLLTEAKEIGIDGIFVLSTCNRTEISGFTEYPLQLINLLCKYSNGSLEEFTKVSNV